MILIRNAKHVLIFLSVLKIALVDYCWINIILYHFLQKIWLFEKIAVYLHCGIIPSEFADSRIVKWRRKNK